MIADISDVGGLPVVEHNVELARLAGEGNMPADAKVKRGRESWDYIYIFLGFALTVAGNFVGMLDCLGGLGKVLIYAAFCAAAWALFIHSGRFQKWLIGRKNRYEERAR
jgi:hypothetical protein